MIKYMIVSSTALTPLVFTIIAIGLYGIGYWLLLPISLGIFPMITLGEIFEFDDFPGISRKHGAAVVITFLILMAMVSVVSMSALGTANAQGQATNLSFEATLHHSGYALGVLAQSTSPCSSTIDVNATLFINSLNPALKQVLMSVSGSGWHSVDYYYFGNYSACYHTTISDLTPVTWK